MRIQEWNWNQTKNQNQTKLINNLHVYYNSGNFALGGANASGPNIRGGGQVLLHKYHISYHIFKEQ